MEKIDYRDFFNFDDNAPLMKAIEMIEAFQGTYSDMIKSVTKDNKKLGDQMGSLRKAAKESLKTIESLGVTHEKNQQQLIKAAKSSSDLLSQTNKLNKAQADNEKTLTKLSSKVEKLNKSKSDLVKINNEETGSLSDLKKKLTEAEKAYKSLGDASSESIKKEHLDNVKRLSQEFNTANKAFNEAKKSANFVAGSYNELNQRTLELRKSLKSMEGGIDGTSEEFKKMQQELSSNINKLKEWDNAIGDNFRKVGSYEEALESLRQKAGGLGGVFADLGGSVPLAPMALGAAAVGGLVAAGSELVDITKEVNEELRDTANLTGALGEDLQSLTSDIRATANTFGKDYKEVLESANVLMNEFQLSGTEAMSLINEGFINGADVTGEFLDQLIQYPAQFKSAGLSAQDLINIVTKSTKDGIFSDKGADTIKEAALSLREMTKATSDALKPLGELRIGQIKEAIESGDTFAAIQMVSNGLKEVNLTASESQTIIADVFKGAGEDAGIDFIKSLADVERGAKGATDGMNEYQKAQLAMLQANQDLARAETELAERLKAGPASFERMGISLRTFLIDAFLQLLNVFKPIQVAFSEIWTSLGRIGKSLFDVSKAGKGTISFVELLGKAFKFSALPLRILADSISFLVDAFANLVESSPKIRAALQWFTGGFSAILNVILNIPSVLAGTINAFEVGFSSIKNVAISTFSTIKELILAAFDPTKSISDILNKQKSQIAKAGKDIGDAYNEGYAKAKEKEKAIALSMESEKNKAVTAQAQKDAALSKSMHLSEHKKTTDSLKKAESERLKEINDIRKRASEASLKIYRIEQNEIVRINQNFSDDLNNSMGDRLIYAENASKARINLAQSERDVLLNNSKLLAREREYIEAEYASNVAEIQRDLSENLAKIVTSSFEKDFEIDQLNIDSEKLSNLEDLNNQFQSGEIDNLREFEAEKLRIQEQSQLQSLNSQLDYLERKAVMLKDAGEDTSQIENEISRTRLAISDAQNKGLLEKEQALQNALNDLKNVAFDSALSIIDNLNEAEDQKRQQDLEKLEEQQALELELAGDNQQAKDDINAEFAARKKQIQDEQSKADRKRAIFEKGVAAFDIGVKTAQAVMGAVAAFPITGGLPMSAIVGAIGAVQLAAVLSKPIPSFAVGTESSPEGIAQVNEKGMELMEHGGKKFVINSDGPTYTYLKRGTKILTAEKTKQYLKDFDMDFGKNSYTSPVVGEVSQNNNRIIEQELININRSIKNQKQPILNLGKNDIQFLSKKGQRWIQYANHKYNVNL